jgi:hypothetical protein
MYIELGIIPRLMITKKDAMWRTPPGRSKEATLFRHELFLAFCIALFTRKAEADIISAFSHLR